jgi:Zn-dependent protease
MLSGDITGYLFTLSIFLVSLSVHEYAHGWMAYRFGDDTAARMGRLTLNPVAHISLFGTIIMPLLIGFGWAKPVPVNFSVLNKKQIFLVAAAGPGSNILLVLILAIAFHILPLAANPLIAAFASLAILYNLILAIFNLLPIPPLDGSKMVYASLQSPESIRIYNQFARYGVFILLGFVYFGGIGRIVWPIVEKLYVLLRLPSPF